MDAVFTTLLGGALAVAVTSLTVALSVRLLEASTGTPVRTAEGPAPHVLEDVGAMAAILVPQQLALVLLAVLLASRRAGGTARALGLARPSASSAVLALLVLGMPAAAITGAWLVHLLHPEPESPSLEAIHRLIALSDRGLELWIVFAMISVLPGVAEELFFRGWMQRRLVGAVGPAAGILLAGVAFSAVHWDPVQATGVLPAGLLLGYFAWRTGSVLPAMLGHAAFNFIAVVGARFREELEAEALDHPVARALAVVFLLSPVALLISIAMLERQARRRAGGRA